MLDSPSFLALYEMRLVIEPPAARLAAERAEPAQVNEMRNAVEKMVVVAEKTNATETTGQYREYGPIPELDGRFHEAIAQASGNSFLFEALARLRPQQQTARLYSRRGVPDLAVAVAEHQSILEAIDAGNGEDAAQRMREHLTRARTFLFSILNPDPSP
jgi:DNA-binding FadR family transcriptional regulator